MVNSFNVTTDDSSSSSSGKGGSKRKWLVPLLWCLLVLFLIAAIAIPIIIVYTTSDDNGDRIACFPLVGETEMNAAYCESRGCVWDGIAKNIKCHLPLDGSKSYGYELVSAPIRTDTSLKVDLRRRRLNSAGKMPPSLYGGDWDEVTFEALFYNDQILRFAFYEKGSNITSNEPPVPLKLPTLAGPRNSYYSFELASNEVGQPFDLKVIRKSNNKVLLDTKMGGLTLSNQFNMISFALPSKYLYGIGENPHDSFAHDLNYRMWPIFARDQPPGDGEMNLYGSHPFYMVSEDDGSSHGVFFFNSHAIDVTTMPYPGITYRTIGGALDFFVFLGPEPETVVQQYTSIIGTTVLPPYWALGFQLSRYGYTGTAEIRSVVKDMLDAGIPLEIQYADIDHMDVQADFTLGENFTDLAELVNELHDQGLRFIPILDPAINTEKPGYLTHERAMQSKVYITWYNDTLQPNKNCTASPGDCQELDNVMQGYVWPDGKTGFPDFFKKETVDWWHKELEDFYSVKNISFDGIWIDMNEPAAFDTNLDKPFNWPEGKDPWNLKCPVNEWDDPPYITLSANRSRTKRLSDKTICMVGRQGQNDQYLHYAVHNLYGWKESEATYTGVKKVLNKRSIVITRSTFPTTGQYAGHWLGDNTARWKDMHTSIIGMMEFNMFGINYIGADICGFFVDTTEQLCQRWMELGAFYPFSRNHNTINVRPQEPTQWESVANASKTALNIRYRLLPYLYTLFYQSHRSGSTVVRPLYHEYPTDFKAKAIDKQFLWGPALLISPVLKENETTLSAYLPADTWYDYYTGKNVSAMGVGDVEWNTPLDKINLHLRGGYIIPQQEEAVNTQLSRQNPFHLLVPLNSAQTAKGDLFWDDGESIINFSDESAKYSYLTFTYNKVNDNRNTLVMEVQNKSSSNPSELEGLVMEGIMIYGLDKKPVTISYEGAYLGSDKFTYNEEIRVANLTSLNLPMTSGWQLNFDF